MNNSATHVVTGQSRLSYCNLIEPRANKPGDEPKFSVTVLVPKSDAAAKQRLDAAIAAATEIGVSKKWNGVRPPIIPNPVHDGDGTRPSDGMPFGAECHGCWVFTASAKQAPNIVDRAMNPITDKTEIYSGMYGRVSVEFFPYYAANKRGIGCALINVQKTADGEPLGGSRTTAEDDFGDGLFPPEASPAPVPVPAQSYQQPNAAPPAYQQPVYGQPAAPVQNYQSPAPSYAQPAAPTYAQQPIGQTFNPLTGRYE